MRLLLLLLPAVALASMEVNLGGKVDFDNKYIIGSIVQKGFDKRAITDNDRVIFEIQNGELRSAIERYLGKKPNQVFFTNDTHSGDMYKTYGWDPVQVKIETDTPVDMFEITSEKVVLSRTIYGNANSTTKKTIIQESETTYDTVTSIWNNANKDSANAVEISLNFEVEKDVKSVNHVFAFGSNRKITAKNVWSQNASLDLVAGQKVLAQLEAKKGTLKFQIPYKISLTGNIYYDNNYEDHYFYGFNINFLVNKTLTVHQILSYEFYYGHVLSIINAEDGYTVLNSFAAEGGTSGAQKRKASAAEHAAATGEKIVRKAIKMPFELTDEDLKTIVEEVLEDHSNEESIESSEQVTEKKS